MKLKFLMLIIKMRILSDLGHELKHIKVKEIRYIGWDFFRLFFFL